MFASMRARSKLQSGCTLSMRFQSKRNAHIYAFKQRSKPTDLTYAYFSLSTRSSLYKYKYPLLCVYLLYCRYNIKLNSIEFMYAKNMLPYSIN